MFVNKKEFTNVNTTLKSIREDVQAESLKQKQNEHDRNISLIRETVETENARIQVKLNPEEFLEEFERTDDALGVIRKIKKRAEDIFQQEKRLEEERLERERKEKERLLKICRASSSIPVMTKIVYVDGNPYVDGGLADSVPVIRALKTGHRKPVIILTRNKGYRKKPVRPGKNIYRVLYGKTYPNLAKSMEMRAGIYNKTMDYIDKWEREGKVFVLRPRIPPVSRLERDTGRMEEFYQHGYDLMEKRFGELEEFLERKQ